MTLNNTADCQAYCTQRGWQYEEWRDNDGHHVYIIDGGRKGLGHAWDSEPVIAWKRALEKANGRHGRIKGAGK